MTTTTLLAGLLDAGVTLTLDGDGLIVDGPDAVLTDATLADLAARKAEVLDLLSTRDPSDLDPAKWRETLARLRSESDPDGIIRDVRGDLFNRLADRNLI